MCDLSPVPVKKADDWSLDRRIANTVSQNKDKTLIVLDGWQFEL